MQENTTILPANALQIALQHHQSGNFVQAESLYRQILQAEPHNPDALHFLGILAYQLGQHETAVALISQAIAIYPNASAMYCNLGLALQALEKWDDAVANYQHALTLRPDDSDAHYNLANTLQAQGNSAQAIRHYQQAIALKPEFALAHNNLGNTLKKQGLLEEAIRSYRAAIAAKADYVQAHHHLSMTLQAQGKVELAIASCRAALAIDSTYPDAHCSLGFLLLAQGHLPEGWQYYESRYDPRVENRQTALPNFQFPQWQGQSLQGKSILIWLEQGFGDEIQFCRYVAVLKNLGAQHVSWVCKPPLQALFRSLKEVDKVLTAEEVPSDCQYDYWSFPLSLPLHCQTTLENIPAAVPYLYANSTEVETIAARLNSLTALKVGLCWQGNPHFINDAQRSPGLQPFKPLFDLPQVKFFTLQPNTRTEFISVVGKNAYDLGHEIDASSFAEAAALIMNLDVVISSCTAICHLAGALGKPVWVVLPLAADWRWLLTRDDSPWYPHTRLFRQTELGNWEEVVARIENSLRELIAEKQNA